MKKIVCLMMLLITAFMFNAQSQIPIYQQNFDAGTLPDGWKTVDADGDGYNWTSSTIMGTGYGHEGSAGCYLSQSYNNNVGALTPDNWLISPEIELIDSCELSFWVTAQDAAYPEEHWAVYISTTYDPTATTFDENDFLDGLLYEETFGESETREQAAWQQHTFDLSEDYAGQTVYIAFRHFNCTDMFYFNLDDVTVTALTSNPIIVPSPATLNFPYAVVGLPSVKTAVVNGYNLTEDITASVSAPFTLSTDGEEYVSSVTIDAEDGGTLYVKYTPTDAGEAYGIVMLSSTGATNAIVVEGYANEAASLPYVFSFEDDAENAQWGIVGEGVNQWFIGSAVNNTEDGENALYISNDEGVSNSYTNTASSYSWAYRDINFEPYPEYIFNFKYRNVGQSYYDYLLVYLGTPDDIPGSDIAPASATLVGGPYYSTSNWTEESIALPSTCSGMQRLYFLWSNNNSSGSNPPAAIDDISIVGTNCGTPSSLVVDSVTAESIAFHFTRASENDAQWEYMLMSYSDTATVGIDDTAHTITDLTPDTYYTLKVRNVCDDEETSNWSTVVPTRTACATMVAPYAENFDGFYTDPSPCWKQYTGLASGVFAGGALTSTSYGWSYRVDGQGFPECHPFVNVYGSSCNKWLVSPAIDLSNLTVPTLSFSLALTPYYTDNTFTPGNQADDQFMVVISTDDGATWSAENATIWNNTETGDHSYDGISATGDDILIDLSEYEGQTIRIAFYGESTESGGDNNIHIANVVVDELPTCVRPTGVRAESVLSDAATITWTDEEGSAWQVAYDTAGFDINAEGVETHDVGENSFSIEDLNPNTQYDVYVRTVCSDGYSRWTSMYRFKTLCGVYVVTAEEPFFEDFNTLTASLGIPDCWDNSEGTTTSASYKWSYYAGGVSGACLQFDSYVNSNGNWNALKTPVMNIAELENPMVSFSYKNPDGGDFSVYLSTDGGTTYTTAIATGLTGQSAWTEVTYPLGDLIDEETEVENVVIVFKGTSNYANGDAYIYLDNVKVGEMPSCAKPGDFAISEVASTSVTLTWEEIGEATQWNVAYGLAPFTINDIDEDAIVPADETTLTIDDLTPMQTYVFYVQSVCSDGESEWRGPIQAAPGTFTFGIEGSSTITSCGIILYDNGGPDGEYELNCDYTLTIYPSDPDSVVSITGNLKTESGWDYLYIYDGVSEDATELAALTGTRNNFGPFTSTTGPLTLRFYSDNVNVDDGFVATVSCVAAPQCRAPYGLTLTSVSSDEATVTWTADANANIELYYKAQDDEEYTTVTSSEFTEANTYVMEDLTPATKYYVYVANLCDEDTLETSILSFTTPCVTTVVTNAEPFVEDFDELTSGIPECWDNSEGTTTYEAYKWNYYSEGVSGGCLRFDSWTNSTGNTNMLKTPVLDITDVTNPQLTFNFKNPKGGDFSVYLSTDGGATYENNPIATGLRGVLSWTSASYSLEDLEDAENVVIVFKGTSNWGSGDAYIYIDNVIVGKAPNCLSPIKDSVSYSNVTAHTATISFVDTVESHNAWTVYYKVDTSHVWTPAPVEGTQSVTLTGLDPETTYQVYVVTNCDEPDEVQDATFTKQFTTGVACPAPTAVSVQATTNTAQVTWTGDAESYIVECGEYDVTVDGNTATITGLSSSSSYTVSVQADCGDEGTSTAVTVTFRTACDVVNEFAYEEGFEDGSLGCWTNENLAGTNPWTVVSSSTSAHSGTYCVKLNWTRNTSSRLTSPIFDLTNLTSPMLSFYHNQADDEDVVDTFAVYYRTSITDEWVRLEGYSQVTDGYELDSLALPNPSSTYQIAFVGYGIYGMAIYLDDIRLYDADGGDTPPTPVELPTVTTNAATNVGQTNATLSGTITNPGNVAIMTKGFKWQQDGATTYNDEPVTGETFTATLTTLTPNTLYRYKAYVTTADTTLYGAELTFTTEGTTPQPPAVPTVATNDANPFDQTTATLHATITNPDDVAITAKGFQVRVTDGGTFAPVEGTGTGNTFTANLTGLTPATGYTFKAFITTADTTVFGDEKTFTTLEEVVEPCDVPTNITFSEITKESMKVSWTANADVTEWKVQYRAQNAETWTNGSTQTNSYLMTGLIPQTTYEVQVQAVCSADNVSAWSEIVTETTLEDGLQSHLAKNVVLYPNPAKEFVTVQCTMDNVQFEIETVEVLDVYGKLISTVDMVENPTRINVSGLANGMYFVRVTTDQGVVTKTFIKK